MHRSWHRSADTPADQQVYEVAGVRVTEHQFNLMRWLRIKVQRMGNDTFNPNPISLGFPGEYWQEDISCLVIPIPDTNRSLLVMPRQDGHFAVVKQETWDHYESLLMAAAVVEETIVNYLKGNLDEADTPNESDPMEER